MTRDPSEVSCVEEGPTKWDKSDPFQSQVQALDHEGGDDAALGFFDALIEASEAGPLAAGDYKAPMMGSAHTLNPAWIGEFRRAGRSRKAESGPREYRLYFGEVPEGEQTALAAFLSYKTAVDMNTESKRQAKSNRKGRTRAHEKQTKDIDRAREIVGRWANTNDCDYRELQR